MPGPQRAGLVRRAKRVILISSPRECRKSLLPLFQQRTANDLHILELAWGTFTGQAFSPNDGFQDTRWQKLTDDEHARVLGERPPP